MEEVFNTSEQINLINAAQIGSENKITSMIQQGVDPNEKGEKGVTALHWLMYKNDLEGMELLLKHGANPNLIMAQGQIESVLELAVGKGKRDALILLLDYGGNPNFEGNSLNLLQHALYNRSLSFIELLIEHGANYKTPLEHRSFSLAFDASFHRFYEVVVSIIDKGEDPLFVRNSGRTLVHQVQDFESGSEAYKEVKKIMLDRGVKFPIPQSPHIGVGTLGRNLDDPKVQFWLTQETRRVNRKFNIYMHIIDYYLGKKSSDLKLPVYPEHIVHGDVYKDDVFRSEYKEKVANYYMEAASFLDVVEPDWRNDSPYLPPEFKGGEEK
ncbi:ankyrin repeat domain-containing protein [Agarivorans sp. Z349TD_8]|uniref:ankyrin repeat domain-containing protein n=1 Tax=Agarivorans sp. Z349TD_8 TaxID=3421434 RepID=UPI003D7C7340